MRKGGLPKIGILQSGVVMISAAHKNNHRTLWVLSFSGIEI